MMEEVFAYGITELICLETIKEEFESNFQAIQLASPLIKKRLFS